MSQESRLNQGLSTPPGADPTEPSGSPVPQSNDEIPGSNAPQHEADQEIARHKPIRWRHWKGTIGDVVAVASRTQALVSAVAPDLTPGPADGFLLKEGITERRYSTVDSFETDLRHANPASIDEIRIIFYPRRPVDQDLAEPRRPISLNLDLRRQLGASLRVFGEDKFAVAGVENELRRALDEGKRWPQKIGDWPRPLWYFAPWVSITGLALAILIGGETGTAIGLSIAALGLLMALPDALLRFLVPAVVPALELLQDADESTVYAKWKRRTIALGAFIGATILGALINRLTGLF